MIDKPINVRTEAMPAAVIRFTIPRDQIQQVMGPAIQEVMQAVTTQGIGPAGPLFSHHFKMSPETFDFEVGVPVTTPVLPKGRVYASGLPATTVIRTVYTGPYEGLGEAWGEFVEQVELDGHQLAENLWECYLSGPETGTDASTYRTELNKPVIK
jgi:effector-binding domain-containing protein